jgi:phospholipid/cholesterol/gamma-HCH transport system substrate-binding protein
MSKSRLEWKVGLFVLISLLLLTALVIRFSKGASLFVKTTTLFLKTENAGGIIEGAMVLMAGVSVGNVETMQLEPGGREVTLVLKIQRKYPIHRDAVFSIRQAGFLGDRYVSIEPTKNQEPPLNEGEVVHAAAPFDIQAVAESAAGLLRRVDDTTKTLNDAITRIDHSLLAEKTLTNLTSTLVNFGLISERALMTLNGVDEFVKTNSHPLSASVSNLVVFSEQMEGVARDLREIVVTNRTGVAGAIKNIESVTLQVDKLVTDLQSGKGLAGSLLKNEKLEQDFMHAVNNLSLLSSNLNKYGLLYRPKVKKETPPSRPIYPGRTPHR